MGKGRKCFFFSFKFSSFSLVGRGAPHFQVALSQCRHAVLHDVRNTPHTVFLCANTMHASRVENNILPSASGHVGTL